MVHVLCAHRSGAIVVADSAIQENTGKAVD